MKINPKSKCQVSIVNRIAELKIQVEFTTTIAGSDVGTMWPASGI